ncbi:MAG TPA: D-alanyl-D-alanine carboxypeptidase [Blastocatellia bacterium]|nr:D-alanyl-D-alanine carboxypeptidase [Blastocatellia bacterium]
MRSRFLPSRILLAIIALTLIGSLALAAPVKRGGHRGGGARKVSRASKASGRHARVSSRRGGRSDRLSARGGRGRHGRLARGRGRYRGSRWARHNVAAVGAHGARVHDFLTQEWSKETTAPLKPPSATATPTMTAVGLDPNRSLAMSNAVPAPAAAPDTAKTNSLNQTLGNPASPLANQVQTDAAQPPLNPLVQAYADSLAARGISAINQGFIVTTLAGEVLAEHNADKLFNPASVTKVATSLTAISRLGPDFKFRTALYTDGALDPTTGILHGSLYVVGSGDPAFFYENAMMVADKLNHAGVREVDGNLYVLGHFYFNFSTSLEASAKALRSCLSSDTWTPAAHSAYARFLAMRAAEGETAPAGQLPAPPSLKISGQTITSQTVNTTPLKPLAVHTSLPLLRVLKGLNDFSNNWMATVIGNLVGGPDAVERFLKMEVGFKDDEVQFATPSGLGANFISPRSTITILRKLITYLDGKGLTLDQLLPVAGVDAGTLQRRFTDTYRAAVVGKTGTLSGVSALAGVAYTRSRGPLLFVIYNRGGSVPAFRAAQDETIKKVITMYGGPVPVRVSLSSLSRAQAAGGEQSTPQR